MTTMLFDTKVHDVEPFRVGALHYRSRDIGYGVEEETDEMYWTGGVDGVGKLTWVSVNRGADETLYLFPSECIDWLPYTA